VGPHFGSVRQNGTFLVSVSLSDNSQAQLQATGQVWRTSSKLEFVWVGAGESECLDVLAKHSLDGDVFLSSYSDLHTKWVIFEQPRITIKASICLLK